MIRPRANLPLYLYGRKAQNACFRHWLPEGVSSDALYKFSGFGFPLTKVLQRLDLLFCGATALLPFCDVSEIEPNCLPLPLLYATTLGPLA